MADLAKNIICRKCSKNIDPLEVFPGKICLDCHAKKFEDQVRRNGNRLPKPNFTKAISI